MNPFLARWMNSAAYAPDVPGASATPAATPAPSSGSGDAPASSPASGTPSSPAGDDSGGSDEFSSFGSADDFDSVDLAEAPSDGETVVATPAVTPAAAVVPPAATPPVAPTVTPAVAAVPATPAKGDSPSSPVDTLMENLSTNAPALQEWLEQNSFKLSKEEQDAFELDAVGQIPKMMAKVQVAAMKSTLNMLKNLVPQMIDQRTATTSAKSAKAKEAITEFYSSNADLNEKDHGALVTKWANAFRAQNPTASRADAIKFVGAAIRTELGMAAAPSVAAKPQAFSPARPGARQPVVPVAKEHPFAALGMDLDE